MRAAAILHDRGVRNTEPSLVWTPPNGWPSPPTGWAPASGWQPDPNWPPVPAGHQWWQPTGQRGSRRRTAIGLVAASSATEFLFGIYGIVIRTLQSDGLHAGYTHSVSVDLLLANVWLYSMALVIPAGAIGAVELWDRSRSGVARAVAFITLLCIFVCGEVWADQSAVSPAQDGLSWSRDGRSWFALMCVLAIVVFGITVKLLRLPGVNGRERPRASAS